MGVLIGLGVVVVVITVVFTLLMIVGRRLVEKEFESNMKWFDQIAEQVDYFEHRVNLAHMQARAEGNHELQGLCDRVTEYMEEITQKMNSVDFKVELRNPKFNLYTFFAEIEALIAKAAEVVAQIDKVLEKNMVINGAPWSHSRFFGACKTKAELAKKYKDLAKIYHPDNSKTGNAEVFKILKAEYEQYT